MLVNKAVHWTCYPVGTDMKSIVLITLISILSTSALAKEVDYSE